MLSSIFDGLHNAFPRRIKGLRCGGESAALVRQAAAGDERKRHAMLSVRR